MSTLQDSSEGRFDYLDYGKALPKEGRAGEFRNLAATTEKLWQNKVYGSILDTPNHPNYNQEHQGWDNIPEFLFNRIGDLTLCFFMGLETGSALWVGLMVRNENESPKSINQRPFAQIRFVEIAKDDDVITLSKQGLSVHSAWLSTMRAPKDQKYPSKYRLQNYETGFQTSPPLQILFPNAEKSLGIPGSPLAESNTLLFPWVDDDLHRTLVRMWWYINLGKKIVLRYPTGFSLEERLWLCEGVQHLIAPLGRMLTFALDNVDFVNKNRQRVDIMFVHNVDKFYVRPEGVEEVSLASPNRPLSETEQTAYEFLQTAFTVIEEPSWRTTYARWQDVYVKEYPVPSKNNPTLRHFSANALREMKVRAYKGLTDAEKLRSWLGEGSLKLCKSILRDSVSWLSPSLRNDAGERLRQDLLEEGLASSNSNYKRAVWEVVLQQIDKSHFLELYQWSVGKETVTDENLVDAAKEFSGLGLDRGDAQEYAEALSSLLQNPLAPTLKFKDDKSLLSKVVEEWKPEREVFQHLVKIKADNRYFKRTIWAVQKRAVDKSHFLALYAYFPGEDVVKQEALLNAAKEFSGLGLDRGDAQEHAEVLSSLLQNPLAPTLKFKDDKSLLSKVVEEWKPEREVFQHLVKIKADNRYFRLTIWSVQKRAVDRSHFLALYAYFPGEDIVNQDALQKVAKEFSGLGIARADQGDVECLQRLLTFASAIKFKDDTTLFADIAKTWEPKIEVLAFLVAAHKSDEFASVRKQVFDAAVEKKNGQLLWYLIPFVALDDYKEPNKLKRLTQLLSESLPSDLDGTQAVAFLTLRKHLFANAGSSGSLDSTKLGTLVRCVNGFHSDQGMDKKESAAALAFREIPARIVTPQIDSDELGRMNSLLENMLQVFIIPTEDHKSPELNKLIQRNYPKARENVLPVVVMCYLCLPMEPPPALHSADYERLLDSGISPEQAEELIDVGAKSPNRLPLPTPDNLRKLLQLKVTANSVDELKELKVAFLKAQIARARDDERLGLLDACVKANIDLESIKDLAKGKTFSIPITGHKIESRLKTLLISDMEPDSLHIDDYKFILQHYMVEASKLHEEAKEEKRTAALEPLRDRIFKLLDAVKADTQRREFVRELLKERSQVQWLKKLIKNYSDSRNSADDAKPLLQILREWVKPNNQPPPPSPQGKKSGSAASPQPKNHSGKGKPVGDLTSTSPSSPMQNVGEGTDDGEAKPNANQLTQEKMPSAEDSKPNSEGSHWLDKLWLAVLILVLGLFARELILLGTFDSLLRAAPIR